MIELTKTKDNVRALVRAKAKAKAKDGAKWFSFGKWKSVGRTSFIHINGVWVSWLILNKSIFSHMIYTISVCYIDFSIKANKSKS